MIQAGGKGALIDTELFLTGKMCCNSIELSVCWTNAGFQQERGKQTVQSLQHKTFMDYPS